MIYVQAENIQSHPTFLW